MNIGEKPIDLVQLCRRILSEWQYHCPYLKHQRLARVIKIPAKELKELQPQPQEARDQAMAMEVDSEPATATSSRPTTSDKNIGQSNGVGETDKSSSDSGSSSSSSLPSSQASSSSSESTSSKPLCEMQTYFLRQPPNVKITTLKNFFDYFKPTMELSRLDTANLYWGLRFRCVPMRSKFFCYAIIQAVYYLQDLGYTGLLLPGDNVAPICNLLIRKFPIFPTDAQRWVRIVDATKQDARVLLDAQSGTERVQLEHTVIVVKFLNGLRYVIDPTVAAFQMPTLEVKQDPVTKKKVYIRTDKLTNSKEGTGYPVIIHGPWQRYIDYINLRSLFGTDPVKSEEIVAALRQWNIRVVRPETTDPDVLLDNFSCILHKTLQELPSFATSLHSTIASVVANIDEECCAFCGEIERGAGDGEEYDAVELYKCGGCKSVLYCGKMCQETDFYLHQEKCRKIQAQAQGTQGSCS